MSLGIFHMFNMKHRWKIFHQLKKMSLDKKKNLIPLLIIITRYKVMIMKKSQLIDRQKYEMKSQNVEIKSHDYNKKSHFLDEKSKLLNELQVKR